MSFGVLVGIGLLLAWALPLPAVEIRVVRPAPGEALSIAQGSVFVIGTVSPAGASVTCNGTACDVSDDGAYIGFVPIQRLDDLVKENGKQCDANFHFEAKAKMADGEFDSVDLDIRAYTPRSPSAAISAREVFDSPRLVRILRDVWAGLEGESLGNVLFLPRGCFLRLHEGNTRIGRYKLARGPEISISHGDWESVGDESDFSPKPAPIEFSIPNQKTIRVTPAIEDWKSSTPSSIWGFRLQRDDEHPRIKPFLSLRKGGEPIDSSQPLKGLRVCLDPGHHPDPGAIGPRATEERDSVRWIAEQTAVRLQEQGAEVSFTHDANPLPLRERHQRMRDLNPDLVLSIHNNSVDDGTDPRKRHGTQTFYLYPWSKPLAEAVHKSMLERLGTTDMGCIRRNLYITRFPECPSILVEPEYLILPDQEKKFLSADYRDRLARALVEGIRNFAAGAARPVNDEKSPSEAGK